MILNAAVWTPKEGPYPAPRLLFFFLDFCCFAGIVTEGEMTLVRVTPKSSITIVLQIAQARAEASSTTDFFTSSAASHLSTWELAF